MEQQDARQFIANEIATSFGSFRRWLGNVMGQNTKRDLWAAFGYPEQIEFDQYEKLYQRFDIAERIIRAYPQATWRKPPLIRDEKGDSAIKQNNTGKKNDNYSPFVEACEDLWERKQIGQYLDRVDRLSGIGQYAVLYLGFPGASDTPLGAGKKELLYMTPFNERQSQVAEWEDDKQNPRYGLPRFYNLQKTEMRGGAANIVSFRAHHSRVLHVAEFLDSDEVYGAPRLRSIYNRLLDLEKVVGGGAEMFWLNGRPNTLISADKDAQYNDAMRAKASEQIEELENGLRRTLMGQGMSATTFGPNMAADPRMVFDCLIDLIAGAKAIPKRILLGSERGELASSQDENNFDEQVDARRVSYAAPRIIRPLVDILIQTGNLPAPKGEYWVEWPEEDFSSPAERADVATKTAAAIRDYTNAPAAGTVVAPEEFRIMIGLDPASEYELEDPDDVEEPIDESDPNLTDGPNAPADPNADPADVEETEEKADPVAP